jgi:hypothetical protein
VWQRGALIDYPFLPYEVAKKKILPPHRLAPLGCNIFGISEQLNLTALGL